MSNLTSALNGKIESIKNKTSDMIDGVHMPLDFLDNTSAELATVGKKVRSFIGKNPLLCVAAAVTVGFVATKMFQRKRSHA